MFLIEKHNHHHLNLLEIALWEWISMISWGFPLEHMAINPVQGYSSITELYVCDLNIFLIDYNRLENPPTLRESILQSYQNRSFYIYQDNKLPR